MRYLLLLSFLLSVSSLQAEPSPIIHGLFVSFPSPSASDLDRGYIDKGIHRTNAAINISVPESSPKRPWTLYIRTGDAFFIPSSFGKPAQHLLWKFNEEDTNAFRRMSSDDQVVFHDPVGNARNIALDLRLLMGWEDPPASYSLELFVTILYQ